MRLATKLKGLKITSADLVDQGANPDAYIRLFKSKDKPKEETDTMKIDKSKMSAVERATLEDFEKRYGQGDRLDDTQALDAQAGQLAAGLKKMGASTVAPTLDGQIALDDQTALGVAKAEGAVADPGQLSGQSSQQPEIHPEVKKALADFEAVRKAQDAKIEELTKSLEVERLTGVAKKYELIGRKPAELAPKLYDLKKAGGTAYDDYVAMLDEIVNTVEKGGMFRGIGSGRNGGGGIAGQIEGAAADIAKGATLSGAEAVVRAFEGNPELAAQYDREYMSGGTM